MFAFRDGVFSQERTCLCLVFLLLSFFPLSVTTGTDLSSPEEVIKALVVANATKDFATMSRLMAHDDDAVNYTIGGRKYVGWAAFAIEMKQEFDSVDRLEIPIRELNVWTRGDIAWFSMELDYVRYLRENHGETGMLFPLRETGVLERRNGSWVLVAWHESTRSPAITQVSSAPQETTSSPSKETGPSGTSVNGSNLSGEWEIQEEDRSYKATLDAKGNGSYTWQGGTITTTQFVDRQWEGTWHQSGNDREGGFEVLLSEDGSQAKGVWWYTRVGDKTNIPPRRWGGGYTWTRLTPVPPAGK